MEPDRPVDVAPPAAASRAPVAAGHTGMARDGLAMALLGGATMVVAYLLTVAGVEGLRLDSRVVYPVAVVTASVLNFLGCRYGIFRRSQDSFLHQALKFAASIAAFRGMEVLLFSAAITLGLNYHIAFIGIALLSFPIKVLVSRHLVFR